MKQKKFRYPLEALLKIKAIEEEKALHELGKILSKINQANQEVQSLENQYKKEITKFNQVSDLNQNVLVFQNFTLFLNRLQETKTKVQNYIQSLQPELEEKRQNVLDARKNKRILEILKEKKFEEYKKGLKKNETKELFEINQNSKRKEYEILEESKQISEDNKYKKESSVDYKTRREREIRKYFRNRK